MNTLNYPIETPEAEKFWGSSHKCNIAKAIIAFSLDEANANDNLRRYGYTRAWRNRVMYYFKQYVNQPTMAGIPFSEGPTPWWQEIPYVAGEM